MKKLFDKYKKDTKNKVVRSYTDNSLYREELREKILDHSEESYFEAFKRKCTEVCSDGKMLCDILIDLCYKSETSKYAAWGVSGENIIENLLKHNNYTIEYPELDEDGDISFGGYKFSIRKKILDKEGLNGKNNY